MEQSFEKAMDDFIAQRICDHEMKGSSDLSDCLSNFEKFLQSLQAALSPEQNKILIQLENEHSLVVGETTNHFYRVGFADAVLFLLEWRNGQ